MRFSKIDAARDGPGFALTVVVGMGLVPGVEGSALRAGISEMGLDVLEIGLDVWAPVVAVVVAMVIDWTGAVNVCRDPVIARAGAGMR